MQSLGQADDGRQLRLALAEVFALHLPENPTTGFRWSIIAIPACLRMEADDFAAPLSSLPGAPGNHAWKFEATSLGSGELRLELAARTPRTATPTSFSLFVEIAPMSGVGDQADRPEIV